MRRQLPVHNYSRFGLLVPIGVGVLLAIVVVVENPLWLWVPGMLMSIPLVSRKGQMPRVVVIIASIILTASGVLLALLVIFALALKG
jgi:hypothetical protein